MRLAREGVTSRPWPRLSEHLSPEHAPLLAGLELADSLAFDFHTWGQVPYDAGFVLVRDGEAHRAAFAAGAAYLVREPMLELLAPGERHRRPVDDAPWPRARGLVVRVRSTTTRLSRGNGDAESCDGCGKHRRNIHGRREES